MLINGKQSNQITASNRGLAYGDGFFSTIKVKLGEMQLWDLHLTRLQKSAKRLSFPLFNWHALTLELQTFAKQCTIQEEMVIKIILSRGAGGRGYSIDGSNHVDRIISLHALPLRYQQWQHKGIPIIQCDYQLPINKRLAGLKTLNRLDQVLIKQEIETKKAIDGIVCDNEGNVIEASSANLFIHNEGRWYTPCLKNTGIEGVKRQQILNAAKKHSVDIIKTQINKLDLLNADAICITNALMGIVPVTQYEKHTYKAQHFSITAQLKKLISKELN